MNKARFCVGIDVGKDELVVAGEGKAMKTFGTTAGDVKRLARWVIRQAKGQAVQIGMEATGVYSHGVASELHRYEQFVVSVINPAQIKAFGRAMLVRTKTDRVDAKVIREFVRSQQPKAWTPPSPVRQQLYALVVQADALGMEIRQWKNRQHAQERDVHVPEAVTRSTTAIIDALTSEHERLYNTINDLCATEAELAEDMDLLTSIKGVGIRSATQILAYGGESLTNRSRRQLDAHAGLVPAERQSGTSVRGKSRLAKQGNARLRHALYMPTLVAVHFNPTLAQVYKRLVASGKAKKVALVACMRKLLNIIRAMLTKRKAFEPHYQPLT